jgi:hypothetical protein
MNAEHSAFDRLYLLGETATHALARLLTRLPLHPQGAGRIRKAAKAATATLSLLRGGHAIRRTIGRVQLRFLG